MSAVPRLSRLPRLLACALVAAVLLVPTAAAGPAAAAETIVDGGFEATVGTSNPHWANVDPEFPDGDLCITGNYCGDSGDPNIVPRSGSGWVWFGGTDVAGHTAHISQSVHIPANKATLTFYSQFGYVETPYDATVTVTIDGAAVATITEPAVLESSYQQHVADVSAYATGSTHTLQITYLNPSLSYQDVSIDDVSIDAVDTIAPNTTATGPAGGIAKSLAVPISFTSTEAGSTFNCSVDGGAFASCASPSTFSVVSGTHTVRVAARDGSGNTDATPAAVTFKAYDCVSLKQAIQKAKKKVKKLKAALREAKADDIDGKVTRLEKKLKKATKKLAKAKAAYAPCR